MRRWCWINATPFYQFCWTYNFIIVKPFNGNDSFSGETGNAVFNRRRKQVSKSLFFSFSGQINSIYTDGMEWISISGTRESHFIFRRTQLNLKLSNAAFYLAENTLWGFFFDVPFQLPTFKCLRELEQAKLEDESAIKVEENRYWNTYLITDSFMLAVPAVSCLTISFLIVA